MDYLYCDMETNRRLATPKWYTTYIKVYPMIRLGEFCKEFELSMDIECDTDTDISRLYFCGYGTLGKTGVRYSISCDEINNYSDISNIEDIIIKRLTDDFDIKEALLYMRIPRCEEDDTFDKEKDLLYLFLRKC